MTKIQDYAIIGNCRSAALVSKEGSMDWLCWPRFDSDPVFSALLDETRGRWSIRPMESFESSRRYVGQTNTLETTFDSDCGTVILTDLMPVASEGEKRSRLFADHEVLRKIECIRGEMDLELFFMPGSFRKRPKLRFKSKGLGIRASHSQGILILRGSTDLPVEEHFVRTRITIRRGEIFYFSLIYSEDAPAVLSPINGFCEENIQVANRWWEDFAQRISFEGLYKDMVIRSALVLKLMSFSPSGAIVASVTTSLPEKLGGDLNWDYRYCWLRDASLTTHALVNLKMHDEAKAFVNWLLHTTHLTLPKLNVLYDVYGRKPQREKEIPELKGFAQSSPVRFGNLAVEQQQLDIYGEVIHGAAVVLKNESSLDQETQKMLKGLGHYICRHWTDDDSGMWEVRGRKEHHTHSLLLCWAGLKGLLDLHRWGLVEKLNLEEVADVQNRIANAIEQLAWNEACQSYISTLRGQDIDANLLLLPWYGFVPFDSPKMRLTYERIRQELSCAELLYRNRELKEGAFLLCSLWAVEYLARGGGTPAEARHMFEDVLSYSNDLGLFSEEVDPSTGDLLGNFPLTFTHMGIVNAALAIHEREEQDYFVQTMFSRMHS